MALNLSIKNVPEPLADRLRRRAQANHRSLQGELMALIEASVGLDDQVRAAKPTTTQPARAERDGLKRDTPTLTLREAGARMRARFPDPLVPPAGESAVDLVRQMRDGRDGSQWRDASHHQKGY